VFEVPAAEGAGLFGSINDAWQAPLVDVGPEGADEGRGARYLLLPPGYEGDEPDGYIVVRSSTYNAYSILRAIAEGSTEADIARAIGLVRKLRCYPLAEAASPPQQRHIDIAGKPFDGIAAFDDSFFDALARMIDEEPVQERDLAMMGLIGAIGIEKGQLFRRIPRRARPLELPRPRLMLGWWRRLPM